MKITVKTLLNKGFSQRAISKELDLSRVTVRKYLEEINTTGIQITKIKKVKKLDKYKDSIEESFRQGLTGILIQEKLLKEKSFKVSYASVSRFLQQFKDPEVYIPLIAKPVEERQVDFGYLGKFIKDGKSVKVWCFSMVLSHSRYRYHCLVTDQNVDSFIRCHIKSFEYFGAVPNTVKIDNLKAEVTMPNFYKPTIKVQYAEFLNHYNCAPNAYKRVNDYNNIFNYDNNLNYNNWSTNGFLKESSSPKSYDEFSSCPNSNKNEPYDQLFLLGAISQKIRNDRPSDYCILINSQYVDGKYVVRFSMPKRTTYSGFQNEYFEVSKSEFQKLLID